MNFEWTRNRTIAGAAALVAAVALALGFGASRSGAAADSKAGSLNVELPRAASDRIYAAPGSAGRPLVVIDAGHGGTDPGAISVSREISEKQLT
ncbi:MAG TPA: N-acetylmuramoyl-L-alanine amidase, partial [Sphingomicrobium sp.]|nr:N-acetylmuramoyl-L-alanine amidase [Sphingomicrobium sp.]